MGFWTSFFLIVLNPLCLIFSMSVASQELSKSDSSVIAAAIGMIIYSWMLYGVMYGIHYFAFFLKGKKISFSEFIQIPYDFSGLFPIAVGSFVILYFIGDTYLIFKTARISFFTGLFTKCVFAFGIYGSFILYLKWLYGKIS